MANAASLYPRSTLVPLAGEGWKTQLCVAHVPADKGARFLLIHGNPSHLDDWSQTVPALTGLGSVAAYDQVGFGRSERLTGREPTLDACADVALALANSLGWTRFVVIGQSHGGMLAHTLAARSPERIEAIVLLGTGGTPAHLSYRLLALPGVRKALAVIGGPLYRQKAARGLARAVTAATIDRSYSPDPIPEGLLETMLESFARRPDVLETMSAVALGDPCGQVARQCPAVRAPALFIHGEDDQLVPIAFARRLFELTAKHTDARFVAMRGGHMLHYCRAPEVNAALVQWLLPHPASDRQRR
jgi:4,5:9,10-diseco-3-hydroxy-5,9,17-trioxoandrosta-1(10),2-diene-4-oate hydrolase